MTVRRHSRTGKPTDLFWDEGEFSWNIRGDGFLRCQTHQNTAWDECIQNFITEYADAVPFWAMLEEGNPDFSIKVMVPTAPTIALFQEVKLDYRAINKGTARACEVWGKMGSGTHVEVGIISPGDGIVSLRTMLFQYFAGVVLPNMLADPGRTCKSAAHGMKAETQWKKSLRDDAAAIRQYYCLHMTNKCTWCQANNALADDWDSDLIPDESGTKAPTRWGKSTISGNSYSRNY